MDSSPTALFDSYEQDYKELIEGLRLKLDDAAAESQDAEARKATLRRADLELDEADEMVSQMDIEIQGIPQSIRPQYQARLREAKSDLAKYKKLHKDANQSVSRATLLSSSGGQAFTSDEPYGVSDRSRLLAGANVLEDGSRRLHESQRLALETEEQGSGILSNLRMQREQIEHSRETISRAGGSIDRATNTLKTMIRRAWQQKFVTAAIIAVLIILIIVILWEKLS